MIVRLAVIVAVTTILPLMSTAARAAMLQEIQGVVLIDRGGGFDIIDGPTQLNPGDSVIANPGGAAQVVYPDGCRIPVEPGAVIAAQKKSPCSKEGAAPEVTEATADEGGGSDGGGGNGGGLNTTNLLVGGAVVGLGAGAAVLLLADDNETPASP
jgi:hypothetical protein